MPAVDHDRWLWLIAATAATAGTDAAEHVASLYELHGRIAGTLERGDTVPLPPATTRRLHRLLARRLDDLTDEAVNVLLRAL